MIAEFMTQSKTAIDYLSEDERKKLSLKIKEYFEFDDMPSDLSTQSVYDFLWSADPIATEGGIFEFCTMHNLYSEENTEYRLFLKNLRDIELTESQLQRINQSEYHVDEALRTEPCFISFYDIKSPTTSQIEALLKNSFITLISLKEVTPNFVDIGLDKLFVTYCDDKAQYMTLTRQLTMLIRRLIENNGFDTKNFVYKFKTDKHKNYFFDNIEDDFLYLSLFSK